MLRVLVLAWNEASVPHDEGPGNNNESEADTEVEVSRGQCGFTPKRERGREKGKKRKEKKTFILTFLRFLISFLSFRGPVTGW